MSMKKLTEEIEFFHSYLRQSGLKKTYQKDLILETFLNTEGHLSVEEIYALVKKKDKKVGIVTVFRTLKALKACGIAREITLDDGLTRFEHSYHHPHHHHIVCTKCHRAIEFICPELERIQSEIVQKYRFEPERHLFQTYGLCEDCREKRKVGDLQKHDTERIFARDAVRMALFIETRCIEFYRDAARRNQNPAGKKILEQIIGAEEKQIAELNAKLDEITSQEKDLEHAPLFLHFDRCELEALIPDLSKYEVNGEISINAKASIDLALGLNRRLSEFFKAYAGKFSESQGREVLLNFANQEEEHSNLIRQRMNENLGESEV